MERDTKLQQLFQLLRWCGAAMIVTAAGTFLVQSWDETGDVLRYLALLGMTALLPAVGYLCGVRFQEGRSARVLVVAFLGLLPIHAGVLGGFVLSQFGTTSSSIAPIAQWVAPSAAAAIGLLAGASAILAPLTWGAYRVLDRQHATLLTATSLGGHALLLIPDRGVLTATLATLPVLAAAGWCALRNKPETRESKLAIWTLLAPAVVIAARQALFYEVSSGFWAPLLGAGAIALFGAGRASGDTTVERLALVPTLLASGAILDELCRFAPLSESTAWLTLGLMANVPLLAFAWSSQRSGSFFLMSAVVLNAIASSTALLIDPRPWAALQALAIGLGLMSYGYIRQRRATLYAGVALGGLGFVVEVGHAIEVFELSGWLALGAFGLGLVALTAWLERRARVVRASPRTAKVSSPASAALP
jgi:hypothetical protein